MGKLMVQVIMLMMRGNYDDEYDNEGGNIFIALYAVIPITSLAVLNLVNGLCRYCLGKNEWCC